MEQIKQREATRRLPVRRLAADDRAIGGLSQSVLPKQVSAAGLGTCERGSGRPPGDVHRQKVLLVDRGQGRRTGTREQDRPWGK